MRIAVPLSTLLSQALVAFTIEVDNEFEQRMPHTTTVGRKAGEPARGPWLVSLPMWSTFMKFVPPDGVSVAEFQRESFQPEVAVAGRNPGMVRWGYVTVGPDSRDQRPKPPRRDWLIVPTQAGRRAQSIWQALPTTIEERWSLRYGHDAVDALQSSLKRVVDQFGIRLPDYLPANGAHDGRATVKLERVADATSEPLDLSVLLSKALFWFTLGFERESQLSLVMTANLVRVLGPDAIAVRDLPSLTGVAKETLAVMLGFLDRDDDVVVDHDARPSVARLTSRGQRARDDYHPRVQATEDDWRQRFGADAVLDLREALDAVVGDPVLARSPLAAAIEPPPSGWRARVKKPAILPHHPVVSHRGGYPDGS